MASNDNFNQSTNPWLHNSNTPGPSGDDRSLRQPKADTESRVLGSRVLNVVGKNKQQELKKQQELQLPVISGHQLSADAKEFVPRSMQSQPQPNHHQWVPGLSGEAPAFYPMGTESNAHNLGAYQGDAYDPYYLEADFSGMNLQDEQDQSSLDPLLHKFLQTLHVLTMNPGNIKDYLKPICELINSKQAPDTDVKNMVDSLFEQSLREANFRYTGARVCQYLTTHLKGSEKFMGFHKKFMNRCAEEYNKKTALLNGSEEEQERLRGFVILMAEIFLNVQVEREDGTYQRMMMVPGKLILLAECLLTVPNEMNVKCVCQLFKLSGALIEDVVKHLPTECAQFEEVFSTMKSLSESSKMSEDAKFRIRSVINQKEANWNRGNSSPPKKSSQVSKDPSNFQRQEPVFYNHQGLVCSREEAGIPDDEYDESIHILNEEEEEALRQFEEEQDQLTENYSGAANGQNDTGFGDDAGGMGAELEDAFEGFLQQLQQQQPQKPRYNNYHTPPTNYYGYDNNVSQQAYSYPAGYTPYSQGPMPPMVGSSHPLNPTAPTFSFNASQQQQYFQPQYQQHQDQAQYQQQQQQQQQHPPYYNPHQYSQYQPPPPQ